MKISYEYKHASEATSHDKKFIRKLCIKDIGLIWDEFTERQKDKDCFITLAHTSKDTIIGWGLLYYCTYEEEWKFSVYVKNSYRRKGIGTKIYRKMKRNSRLKNNDISVYRHDDRSIFFFDKLQKRD